MRCMRCSMEFRCYPFTTLQTFPSCTSCMVCGFLSGKKIRAKIHGFPHGFFIYSSFMKKSSVCCPKKDRTVKFRQAHRCMLLHSPVCHVPFVQNRALTGGGPFLARMAYPLLLHTVFSLFAHPFVTLVFPQHHK